MQGRSVTHNPGYMYSIYNYSCIYHYPPLSPLSSPLSPTLSLSSPLSPFLPHYPSPSPFLSHYPPLSSIVISIHSVTAIVLLLPSRPLIQDLCDNYFLPLIQLLSSQTTFPSGGVGRSAVCRSMVDLLLSLGERLGRDEAINVLTDTLQGFFSCFSSVHSNEEETQLWGTPHNGNY